MANSASTEAMARYLDGARGLSAPQLARPVPGLPTLPDLKKLARDRRAAGAAVIDQSAGDIDDVGQPLSDAFVAWVPEARARLIAAGHTAFRHTEGDAFGFSGAYCQQYPIVTETLARSWGIAGDGYRALQTVSGRTIIDLTLRGLLARADEAGKGARRTLVLDPLAWSGYRPLARDLGLELVHQPVRSGRGLAASVEGLEIALRFARDQGLDPVGVFVVLPSNPTGVGLEREELARLVEHAAAEDVPLVIDAFYSPLAREGHAEAVPLGWLQSRLAPEALAYLGAIVGETKVTSSQNKTGTLLWLAPEGRASLADRVWGAAAARMRSTNVYPRPNEALVAYALHTFPDGIHAAMGPRFQALDAAREAMRRVCDRLALPLSIGGSFYGTAALVDREGRSMVRDDAGQPLTDAAAISLLLIERYGLVGAPGGMFSPAPEAATMVRLTAAVTAEQVEQVGAILESLLDASGAR